MHTEDQSSEEELELLGMMSLFGNLIQYTENQKLKKELEEFKSNTDPSSNDLEINIPESSNLQIQYEDRIRVLENQLQKERNNFSIVRDSFLQDIKNLKSELQEKEKRNQELQSRIQELVEKLERKMNQSKIMFDQQKSKQQSLGNKKR